MCAAVGLPDIVIHCQSGGGPVSTGDEECPVTAQDLALSAAQLAHAFLPPFVDRQAGVVLALLHAGGGSPRQRAAAAAVEGLAQALREDARGTGVAVQEVLVARDARPRDAARSVVDALTSRRPRTLARWRAPGD